MPNLRSFLGRLICLNLLTSEIMCQTGRLSHFTYACPMRESGHGILQKTSSLPCERSFYRWCWAWHTNCSSGFFSSSSSMGRRVYWTCGDRASLCLDLQQSLNWFSLRCWSIIVVNGKKYHSGNFPPGDGSYHSCCGCAVFQASVLGKTTSEYRNCIGFYSFLF